MSEAWSQLDFPPALLFRVEADDEWIGRLVRLLLAHGALKRKQIAELLAWDERTIRSVAEAAPDQIVSGQFGYQLVASCSLDDLVAAGRQMVSQDKRNVKKGLKWLRLAASRANSVREPNHDAAN